MRTSRTHPLQIAALPRLPTLPLSQGALSRLPLSHSPLSQPPQPHAASTGRVGLTFCPGKVQPQGATGAWKRDLGLDLDAVAAWGAVVVVTLVEDHELSALQVPALGAEVAARHMEWLHLPIPDGGVPGAAFEAA